MVRSLLSHCRVELRLGTQFSPSTPLLPTCARWLGLGPAHLCAQENPISHSKPLSWPFINDKGGKSSSESGAQMGGVRAKVTSLLP